ncbi:hypothetical protein E2542_SST30886 [Spatholobus suberectus]|nr:hypothetical protein E2542_SST30886 [Spatholobus suberectus]
MVRQIYGYTCRYIVEEIRYISMGNRHGGIRLLKNGECSYHFQLGQSASMIVKEGKKKRDDNGKRSRPGKSHTK